MGVSDYGAGARDVAASPIGTPLGCCGAHSASGVMNRRRLRVTQLGHYAQDDIRDHVPQVFPWLPKYLPDVCY